MEKICGKCGIKKNIKDFHFRDKEKNTRKSWCKTCTKEYDQNKYKDWRNSKRKAIKKWRSKQRKENIQEIFEYFKTHPCIDCGETNPIVLEFDHIKNKKFAISNKISSLKWETLLKEIKKCEVRCANCHKIKTAKQRNYYKYLKNENRSNR